VTQVTEVLGVNRHTGVVDMRDVMGLVATPAGVRLAATGTLPTFVGELVDQGLLDLERWFEGASA